jgi:hypothetical protein
MKKVFILFLLMFLSAPAFAAEWFQFDDKAWIDVSSRQFKYDTVTAWVKFLNPGDWEKFDNKKIWYQMRQIKADCSKKTTTYLYLIVYDLKENPIFTHNYKPYEQEETPVVPNSIGELMHAIMCTK